MDLNLTLTAPYADTLTPEERHDGVLVRVAFREDDSGTSFTKFYSDHSSNVFGPFQDRAATEDLVGDYLEQGFVAESPSSSVERPGRVQ